MRKILVVLLTVAMIGLFGNAFAKIGLNIHGGWNFLMPMGDYADGSKFSFLGFGGGATINITPMIGIDTDFVYQLDIPTKTDPAPDGYKHTMMYLNFGARINLITGGSFVPFAGGGMGYYMAKVTPSTGVASVSDNNIGIYFGGGIDYFFTPKIGLDTGVKFHYVLSSDDTVTPALTNTLFLTFGVGIAFVAL